MDEDLQAVGLILVRTAAHDDAGLLFGKLCDDPALHFPEDILIRGAKGAVGECRGQKASGRVLARFLDIVLGKAALLRELFDELGIIAGDAELIGDLFADGAAAAAEFAADGDDTVI